MSCVNAMPRRRRKSLLAACVYCCCEASCAFVASNGNDLVSRRTNHRRRRQRHQPSLRRPFSRAQGQQEREQHQQHHNSLTNAYPLHATSSDISATDDAHVKSDEPISLHLNLSRCHPIIASALLRAAAARNGQDGSAPSFGLADAARASAGIAVWTAALRSGRLPIEGDFDFSDLTPAKNNPWPEEPLYTKLSDVLTELQLPRFALRHPETVHAVMLGMFRLSLEFAKQAALIADSQEENIEDDESKSNDINDEKESTANEGWHPTQLNPQENMERVADEIAMQFSKQWGNTVEAVRSLDTLFGDGHGLLDVALLDDDEEEDILFNFEEDAADGGMKSPFGFGLNDGIWAHSGWKMIPQLQRRLSEMSQLRDLVRSLGKRPAAEGKELQRFPPQTRSPRSALGVELDPMNRESVQGITLTNSLSEMLPSEAVLLKGSPALRRLFFAKKIESRLFGYDISGYSDVPSKPKSRRFLKKLPSAPGGPIIVCLDTSFSMTGDREVVSKAVVLECVKMAHKQQRDCSVVAFSSESNTLECSLLAADKSGIMRLLSFLSHSFSGGTDVTGALRYAMDALGSDIMKSSDILLISDGELQNPPVSNEVMEELNRLKEDTGMEIHGLLVGKAESEPLDFLCTKVHTFLGKYDAMNSLISKVQTT